jgi:hypothetical protein
MWKVLQQYMKISKPNSQASELVFYLALNFAEHRKAAHYALSECIYDAPLHLATK